MPCYTDPPSHYEETSRTLNLLLDEIGEKTRRTHGGNIYGAMRPFSPNQMAVMLCAWCKANDPTTKSLEFQIWWRDHQADDAQHEKEEAQKKHRESLRRTALAKLSKAEKRALEVKE